MVAPGSPRHELLKSWKVTLWVLSHTQFLKDWFLLIPCISNMLLNWFQKLYLCYRCVSWREAVAVIWSPVPGVVPGGQKVAGKCIIFIVSHDYLSDHPDRFFARPFFLRKKWWALVGLLWSLRNTCAVSYRISDTQCMPPRTFLNDFSCM